MNPRIENSTTISTVIPNTHSLSLMPLHRIVVPLPAVELPQRASSSHVDATSSARAPEPRIPSAIAATALATIPALLFLRTPQPISDSSFREGATHQQTENPSVCSPLGLKRLTLYCIHVMVDDAVDRGVCLGWGVQGWGL